MSEGDNLNLSEIYINNIPQNILFPDELNQHLKGQIEFLIHTNGMLQRKIQEDEATLLSNQTQICMLNQKLSEFEQFYKPSDNQFVSNPTQLMSGKIIELSKKLKDKTVELESLKTKFGRLQQKLLNVQKSEPEPENVLIPDVEDDKQNHQEELKILQEKLFQANNKLFEVRNSNVQLKNELKAANKILQQELGENFSSIQNVSNNSTWRGRAQQILSLQQKNNELQEKLSSLTIKESLSTIPKVDPRKQVIEQLQKELFELKNELDDTKKKLAGSRARVKVLETECFSGKTKMLTISTKNENDEKLINLLKNQIGSLEQTNAVIQKEKQSNMLKLEDENKSLKQELNKNECIIEELKKILEEKNKSAIEEENNTRSSIIRHSHPHNSPISTKEISKMNILEVEVNRLLELVSVLNTRLDDERNNHSMTQINYKKERQRAAKLELKLSRLELEHSMNRSSGYSKSTLKSNYSSTDELTNTNLTLENLKNSLEIADENVSILKTKLDILQKEKELDYQRFSTILTETSTMLLKYNSNNTNNSLNEN